MSNDIDDQEKNVTYYLIPANVTSRFEFFEGFGWNEFKYVAIAIVIGTIMFFITGLLKTTEQYDKNTVPEELTISMKYGENATLDGDIITVKKDTIPATVRFFFIIIPGVGSFISVKKDRSTGMSLISIIQLSRNFQKRQKRYLYKYGSGSEV